VHVRLAPESGGRGLTLIAESRKVRLIAAVGVAVMVTTAVVEVEARRQHHSGMSSSSEPAADHGHMHAGPILPILQDRVAGPYKVSIWSDSTSSSDAVARGRVWITVRAADPKLSLPETTHVSLMLAPSDRQGPSIEVPATPGRDPATFFATVVLDHEGPFRVHAMIDGPLGPASIDASVTAEDNLRPGPWIIGLSVIPFATMALLWLKLYLRRRRTA
jgi:hypothetical protein